MVIAAITKPVILLAIVSTPLLCESMHSNIWRMPAPNLRWRATLRNWELLARRKREASNIADASDSGPPGMGLRDATMRQPYWHLEHSSYCRLLSMTDEPSDRGKPLLVSERIPRERKPVRHRSLFAKPKHARSDPRALIRAMCLIREARPRSLEHCSGFCSEASFYFLITVRPRCLPSRRLVPENTNSNSARAPRSTVSRLTVTGCDPRAVSPLPRSAQGTEIECARFGCMVPPGPI